MIPQLLETICCRNGQLLNLESHQARVRRSALSLGLKPYPDLHTLQVPAAAHKGLFKCRVLYRQFIERIDFSPYTVRPVRRLKIIRADHIDYSIKFADRTLINAAFRDRDWADDILLIKNGLLTDTSYANIALWDGNRWLTPNTPLLRGTCRARLLQQNRIRAAEIPVANLYDFEKLTLFNAMMDLGEGPVVRIDPANIR